MADGERTKVRLDAFTAKVVPDPKNPGESLLLTGFLGASTESKQTRIYWDPSLSSYVDVDNANIIHSEPLPKEQSPLGGSYIWVKRSAEVSTMRHSRRRRDIVPDARSRGSRILLFASGEPRNPERAHDRMIVEVRRQTLPDGRGSEWALALQPLAEPRPAGSGQLLNPARSNRSSKTSER